MTEAEIFEIFKVLINKKLNENKIMSAVSDDQEEVLNEISQKQIEKLLDDMNEYFNDSFGLVKHYDMWDADDELCGIMYD